MVVSNLLDTISESALKSLLPRLIVVQIFLGEDKKYFLRRLRVLCIFRGSLIIFNWYIMKSKCGICVFVFLMLFISCDRLERNSLSIPVEVIDFDALKKETLSELMNKEKPEYILLKNDTVNELFGRIDKIKIAGKKIYIADTRMRSLIVYDCMGNYLARVGTRGQGPKEYINLSDFDVDTNGNVYVLDSRLNKVLQYSDKYECVEECMLPFAADILAVLNNDSLLFGLSSWNEKDGAKRKIALTDKKGKIGRTYLDYDEFVDPGYWISGYMFADAGCQLAYNQTIDNNVYIFSRKGVLEKGFFINFGEENVPNRDKVEIESKLRNFDYYCLIRKILAVTDKYIIGFIWQHRQTKPFVIDYNSKKCYLGDMVPDIDRRVWCGYSEGNLVSYIDSENEELPDSVNQFIRQEGIALKIDKLNKILNK